MTILIATTLSVAVRGLGLLQLRISGLWVRDLQCAGPFLTELQRRSARP